MRRKLRQRVSEIAGVSFQIKLSRPSGILKKDILLRAIGEVFELMKEFF